MTESLAVPESGELLNVLESKSIDDILKPLTKEIFLLGAAIAGTTYLDDKSVLDKVNVGDQLILQRENNPYDENAILVLNEKHQKLGYVPRERNLIFSRMMDAGKLLTAKVTRINIVGDFHEIIIKIYLVDF